MNDLRYYMDILTEETAEQTIDTLSLKYPQYKNTPFDPKILYDWSIKALSENDKAILNRIEWFVTILKMMYLVDYLESLNREKTHKEENQYNKAIGILGEWRLGTPDDDVGKKTLLGFKYSLHHFYGFQYDKIKQYKFKPNQPINTAFTELKKFEEEYLNKQDKSAGAKLLPGDYWLMKFSDGLTWYYLDRGYCEQEGKLGSHCGNIAGKEHTYERLLSLRTNDGKIEMTFSMDPRNPSHAILGEMKARGNTKPKETFYPHIMALLLYPARLPRSLDRSLQVTYNSDETKPLYDIVGFDKSRRIQGVDFSVFNLPTKYQIFLNNYKPELIESQLQVSPLDILSAHKTIQNEHVDQVPDYIQSLIKDPKNVNNWIEAVNKKNQLLYGYQKNYGMSIQIIKKCYLIL